MQPFVYTPAFARRFWSKVEKTDSCWLWQGALGGPPGWRYGALRAEGSATVLGAHRVSYALDRGYMPPRYMDVCHRCDNPACVNPEHLFLGTRADNLRDMVSKGRAVHPRGAAASRARLDEEKVRTIRADHEAGATMRALAARFGVAEPTVQQVIARRTWAHVA